MHVVKFLLFLSVALNAATQQLETDYIHDPGESTREYIRDQNEEMKKFQKEEMQKMCATMSQTFYEQLLKVTGQLGSLNETILADHQQISGLISNLTAGLFPPRNLTEVEEVNAERGKIEFTAGTNPHVGTKVWVLQSKGGTSWRQMSFVLEETRLGEDSSLSLWGSNYADGRQQLWNGSQDDWREEKRNAGNVILVTLRISPGGTQTPRFKLKFNTTDTGDRYVCSSQVLREEGRQVVSSPLNNTQNYPPRNLFVAVIAPRRGGSVGLTLKHLDIPGTSPENCANSVFVWFLEKTSTGLPFAQLPSSAYRPCGKVGAISESLGNSTVAILRFLTHDGPLGRGFLVEVN